jgi:hypothetical protein
VLHHPGQLDHAPELHLAPLSPDLRPPEGIHQVLGLNRELHLPLHDRPEVLLDRRMRRCAVAVERLKLCVHRLEPVFHRLHQRPHGSLTRSEIGL